MVYHCNELVCDVMFRIFQGKEEIAMYVLMDLDGFSLDPSETI